MSSTAVPDLRSLEYVDGLKKLRSGTLMIIVSQILGIISLIILFVSIFSFIIPLLSPSIQEITILPVTPRAPSPRAEDFMRMLQRIPYLLAILIVFIVLLIIGGIIYLIGLWGGFIPGARRLGKAKPEFGTASTLLWIGWFWGVLIGIIMFIAGLALIAIAITSASIATAFSSIMVFLAGVGIAAILGLIGFIGYLILLYKLYDVEKNTLYLAAFILSIVYLILSFIGFVPLIGILISSASTILSLVSWILLYVALGESIKKISTSPSTSLQPSI
jgi:hypothetical protein